MSKSKKKGRKQPASQVPHRPKRERARKNNQQKNQKKKQVCQPMVLQSHVARLPRTLPRMPHPWVLAPVPVPDGLASPEFQNIIREAQKSIWLSMKGFHFDPLPFLDLEETEHLACCIGLLPNPKQGICHLFDLLADLYRRMGTMRWSYPTVAAYKEDYYANFRQNSYNRRKNYIQRIALTLGALRVPVLMKVMEACMQARRAFISSHSAASHHKQKLQAIHSDVASSSTQGWASFPPHLKSEAMTGDERRQTAVNQHGPIKTEDEPDWDGVTVKTEGGDDAMSKSEDDNDVKIKVEDKDEGDSMDDSGDDDSVIITTEGGNVFGDRPNYATTNGPDYYLERLTSAVDKCVKPLERMESPLTWTQAFGGIMAGDPGFLPQPEPKLPKEEH
jgi:hypothetical protein